jgi:hypothetical protein
LNLKKILAMKKYILNILFITSSIISYAQLIGNGNMSDQARFHLQSVMYKSFHKINMDPLRDDKIVGSKYYNEFFQYGNISIDGKVYSKEFALRFNAYADEIEINNGVDIDILVKDSSIGCIIGEQQYDYLPYIEEDSNYPKMGYLITVFEGKNIKLYSREVKIFKEGRKAKTSLTTSIPPKLVDFEYFLISKNNETPYLIKPRSKEVLKLAPDEFQLELKTFIKENNLKLKKRKDLITFIKKYDMLLSN